MAIRVQTKFSPLLVLLVAILPILLSGCGDDFGQSCTLPPNEFVEDACGLQDADTGESEASCVVENVIECDSRICARYRGSDSFCTETCSGPNDSGCPSGSECREYVVGEGKFYCVLDEYLQD